MKNFERFENNFETVLEIASYVKQYEQAGIKLADSSIDDIPREGKENLRKIKKGLFPKATKYYYDKVVKNSTCTDVDRAKNMKMSLKLLSKVLEYMDNPSFVDLAIALSYANDAKIEVNINYLRYLKFIFPDGIIIPSTEYDIPYRPSDYLFYKIPDEEN